jgi:hypothetical protein
MESDMSKRSRNFRKQRRINVQAAVEQVRKAAAVMTASPSRYAGYDFLVSVYEPYWGWSDVGYSDGHIAASIRRQSDQRHNEGEHPVKMLIKAAGCSLEAKTLSRWVRALEYAVMKQIRPEHLTYIFTRRGGIAGCARLAAKYEPKRTEPPERDDWADGAPIRHI